MEKAQIHAKAWQKNMVRAVTNEAQMTSVSNYAQNIGSMYSHMNQERQVVKSSVQGQSLSMPSAIAMAPRQQAMQHFQRRTDEASSEMFSNSKTNSRAFQKKK